MKKLVLFVLIFIPGLILAQVDQAPIVVNISDNPVLQYGGVAVKQKATCTNYTPVISTTKDFSITISITCYVNSSGAYGTTIAADLANKLQAQTISIDQYNQLLLQFADRQLTYTTIGQCTSAAGVVEPCSTVGAIPEIQFWQTFKLNQVSGIGTLTTQGTADVQYKIIQSIISALDGRKKW